jgi:release factor glutamine methyltransferase
VGTELPFAAAERIAEIAEALRAAKVPAILLRTPEPVEPARSLPSIARQQVDLLVSPVRADAARRALESLDWRFELGRRGVWRAIPRVSYLWDDLLGVHLLWGIPGAPFTLRRAREFERQLWRRAEPGAHGLRVAHRDDLVVYGAVQAARPGRPQKYEAEDLASFVRKEGLGGALDAARAVGLGSAVVRGLRAAGIEAGTVERSLAWIVAGAAWRWARPRRLRGLLLTGTPRLGRAIARSRFAGEEVFSGYGVFLPRGLSEQLVTGALEAVAEQRWPVMVDVGTGCGAVALAIAAAHGSAHVHAIDTSARALWWARANRPLSMLRRVRFHRGSLLTPLPRSLRGKVNVIAANVPYVPPALWGEGWISRAGTVVGSGDDGLGLYRSLVRQARAFLEPGGVIVFQLGGDQWPTFRQELETIGFRTAEPLEVSRGDIVASAVWSGGRAAAGQ